MCHNAWQRPMHVGHMASHVCDTWHAMCQHAWNMEKDIYGVWELFVQAGSSKMEKEGKKKGEGKKGKKEKKRKKREKEKKGREKEREKKSGVPTVRTRQTKK